MQNLAMLNPGPHTRSIHNLIQFNFEMHYVELIVDVRKPPPQKLRKKLKKMRQKSGKDGRKWRI